MSLYIKSHFPAVPFVVEEIRYEIRKVIFCFLEREPLAAGICIGRCRIPVLLHSMERKELTRYSLEKRRHLKDNHRNR